MAGRLGGSGETNSAKSRAEFSKKTQYEREKQDPCISMFTMKSMLVSSHWSRGIYFRNLSW